MSDAEPKSTSTITRDLENANGQPSRVAVSEENLAALLRATASSGEPEAESLAEGAPAAPVRDGNESGNEVREPRADRAAATTNPPPDVVESRLALFAAVKENRSAISRAGLTAATPPIEQSETGDASPSTAPAEQIVKHTASFPPKAAPIPVIFPEILPPAPAPAASIATPSSTAVSPDQSYKTSRTRLVIGLVIGGVIAIGGISTFLTRAHPSKAPRGEPLAPKDSVPLQARVEPPLQARVEPPLQARVEPPLQVRVEPLGNGLIDVRWNPQSASIAQARGGRLVITEHNQQPRTLALEAGQLKTGHLTYQSAAESVEFDLEVVDRSGAIAKESILALQAPVRSPLPASAPPQIKGNTAMPNVQNLVNRGVAAEAPQLTPPKIRSFIPPAAQHNTGQRAVIDAPAILTNGPAMPPAVGLPAPTALILPPPKKDIPVEQQVRVESNIQAANLIKKVIPIYPPIATAARIQGIVRFTAHIGKDGRIVDLKFTSGPPVLVNSASTAVKQWVYRPTLLNGKPVEVITQIDVNFTLH